MKNFVTVLVIGFFVSSCVVVKNSEVSFKNEMTPEQACILKTHYVNTNEEIPDSVKSVLDKSGIDCREI